MASQPWTADGPIVTKSYVDQAIKNVVSGNTSGSGSTREGTTTTPSTTTSDELKIVVVKPDSVLIADAECIVRSGKAVIYSEDANGVADLTEGTDLIGGTESKSHKAEITS